MLYWDYPLPYSVAQAEYPPLELPWFENLRGVELFDVVNAVAFIMQGLFILEILQLKIKYPRITLAIKWFLFSSFLIVTDTYDMDYYKQGAAFLLYVSHTMQSLFIAFVYAVVGYCTWQR